MPPNKTRLPENTDTTGEVRLGEVVLTIQNPIAGGSSPKQIFSELEKAIRERTFEQLDEKKEK